MTQSTIVEISDARKILEQMDRDQKLMDEKILAATRKMLEAQQGVAEANAKALAATQELSRLVDVRDNLELNQTALMQKLYCKDGSLTKLCN